MIDRVKTESEYSQNIPTPPGTGGAMPESVGQDPIDLPGAVEDINRACQVVRELCLGEREWRMSIPARPHHDPDIVIAQALKQGSVAMIRVVYLESQVAHLAATVEEERQWWIEQCGNAVHASEPLDAFYNSPRSRPSPSLPAGGEAHG